MSDTKGQKNAWDALREENERLKAENLLWQESHTLLKMDYNNALAALDEARGALVTLLGLENAATLEHTLRLMSGAVRHLMIDHNCDQHGWENVNQTREDALAYADKAVSAHRAALNERVTKP